MITDRQWLDRFAAGDEEAFAELARRHAGWIQRVAFRQLGNEALADDATQAVFLVLLRRAPSLPPSTPLAAWLHRTAVLVSKEIARRERRLKQREEAFAMMRNESTVEAENLWSEISPLLETTLARLGKADRQAVLLRYYAQRDFADIAAEMGATESAARKRVERALHKLRDIFAGRGISHPDGLFSEGLFHAGGVASAGLIARIGAKASSQIAGQIAGAVARKFSLTKWGLTGVGVGMIGAAVVIGAAKLSPSSRPTPARGAMPAWMQAIARAPADYPTYPAPKVSFDELIGHLQKEESQIKNLHIVHFQATLQQRPSYNKPWENTPAVWEGSAWFDGNVHGRCRVYLKHDAQRWQPDMGNPAVVWTENSNDYGFDGAEGRAIRLTSSGIFHTGGKTVYPSMPAREGVITSGLPLWVNNRSMRYFTGLAYSLQYIVQEGEDTIPPRPHESLAQKLLRYHHIAPKDLLMVQCKINGVDAIGVQTRRYPPPAGWEVWWFDPSRGYALVRYQIHTFSSTEHGMRIDATQWKDAAPGIWFPTAGTAEENYNDSKRYVYSADGVIANDPKFRPGIFQVPLPVGYLIYDRRANPPRLFTVLDNGEEQDIHRGDAMPRVKPDVPKPPKD